MCRLQGFEFTYVILFSLNHGDFKCGRRALVDIRPYGYMVRRKVF